MWVVVKLVWLAAYVALVIRLTWPLTAHVATHLARPNLICEFDQRQMIWALAYASHRLTTAPWRLFEANIYHPTPHALLYAESGLGAVPFFLPTFLVTNDPVLSGNVMLLASLALTAWGLHQLLARWTGSSGAGLTAALTFLWTPWVLWTWAPGAPNYVVLQWVPLIVWLAATPTSRARVIALGLSLAAQGSTSPYVAAGILAPIGALAIVRLARRERRADGVALVVALAVATTALLLVYGGYAWMRWQEPAMPTHTWWPGGQVRQFDFPRDVFLGRHRPNAIPLAMFALIAVGGLCALVRRLRGQEMPPPHGIAWRHGALWSAVGMLVSLPPVFVWFGHSIDVPHVRLLQGTPLFDLMREPQRMGVGALFGLAILAGVAYAELSAAVTRVPGVRPGLARLALITLVAGAGYYTYLFVVWPPESFAERVVPPAYPIVRTSPLPATIVAEIRRRDAVVLQLPAKRSGRLKTVKANADAMLDSTAHWQPIVNGYGGYYPADFPALLELAGRLPDDAALAELRRRTGVSMILVRGATALLVQRAAFEEVARRGEAAGLRLIRRDGADLLFAVVDPVERR
jgi:hypothetical protein